MLNQSIFSDSALSNRDKGDISSISLINENRTLPTIYANRDTKSLGRVLNYGYTHRYLERKLIKDVVQPVSG